MRRRTIRAFLLLIVVIGHPLLIQAAEIQEQPVALVDAVDASVSSVGFDVGHGNRDRSRHGKAASVIQFRERLPHPMQVRKQFWFVLKGFYLEGGVFFGKLFEPCFVLGSGLLAPLQELN